ncbi:hypothetical protein GCM10010345_44280 [Streptomyces canarius]|uniref:Uncharacterized protein n=1 Tax=Streptomyces canarius TaxID=285453 RepID=A0ABQ3CV40_9ACTN|nr:hypothetical protein GCM10010345_44280 [Streptomyces canarius]
MRCATAFPLPPVRGGRHRAFGAGRVVVRRVGTGIEPAGDADGRSVDGVPVRHPWQGQRPWHHEALALSAESPCAAPRRSRRRLSVAVATAPSVPAVSSSGASAPAPAPPGTPTAGPSTVSPSGTPGRANGHGHGTTKHPR